MDIDDDSLSVPVAEPPPAAKKAVAPKKRH